MSCRGLDPVGRAFRAGQRGAPGCSCRPTNPGAGPVFSAHRCLPGDCALANSPRDTYITGLVNAHALEEQAVSLLSRQVERLESYPEMSDQIRLHIDETKAQAQRLEEILQQPPFHGREALQQPFQAAPGHLADPHRGDGDGAVAQHGCRVRAEHAARRPEAQHLVAAVGQVLREPHHAVDDVEQIARRVALGEDGLAGREVQAPRRVVELPRSVETGGAADAPFAHGTTGAMSGQLSLGMPITTRMAGRPAGPVHLSHSRLPRCKTRSSHTGFADDASQPRHRAFRAC
jgi:hypothetical protein